MLGWLAASAARSFTTRLPNRSGTNGQNGPSSSLRPTQTRSPVDLRTPPLLTINPSRSAGMTS
eukprot:3698620-Alexandrium_andersonii.AAC.1